MEALTPAASAEPFRHVAVCGVSFCGSTLLARILGSLPGVANIGESHWLGERRVDGSTVPARPDIEDFALQPHCRSCGPRCQVLDREFRVALLADPRDWYQKIAARLGTRILVSADKNYRKLERLDPELRLDALVLFKDPLHAANSHCRYAILRGAPAPTERDVAEYLERWARSYEHFLDRFAVKGRKVVVSWDRLSTDPERLLPALCDALALTWVPSALREIAPAQHCLGGNALVNRHFRETQGLRFEPPREIALGPELLGVIERHRAREVHRRLRESADRGLSCEAGSISPIVAAPASQRTRVPKPRPKPVKADFTGVLLDAANDQQAELELWRQQSTRRVSSGSAEDEARHRFVEYLCAGFDHDRYREIQRRFLTPESIDRHRGALKYLDLAHWLRVKLELALELGLHRAQPMTILDLGAGPGHFPFVCRYFGHQVLGSDVERRPGFPEGNSQHLYAALLELFEIDKVHLRIERRRELPDLGRRFDLVTALMAKFDNPRRGVCWTADDWVFFLHDLATRHLTPGGRVFLSFNRPFFTPEILHAMRERGAAIDDRKCTVRFDSVDGLRSS